MNFEPVIGIEVHLELNTKNKMFSRSSVDFSSPANKNVSEVDLGYPGALPTVNEQGVEYAIKLADALNCTIDNEILFDRKHYFYYDNSKGYQITQHEKPIGTNGYIQLLNGKKIDIIEMHLEEDTAKTNNVGDEALIDFNRSSIPLIEIVSGSNIESSREAYEYLEQLKVIVSNLGISDAKMEEGSLRVDVNVSVRPIGYSKYNTKTEIKNINSFSNVMKAIEFEVQRQSTNYLKGVVAKQETRGYDDKKRVTVLQRIKETKDDYFYIPETDIFPIKLSNDFIEECKSKEYISPFENYNSLVNELNDESLAKYFVLNIKENKFYNEASKGCNDKVLLANLIKSEIIAIFQKKKLDIENSFLTPLRMKELINAINCGTISTSQGKKIINFVLEENKDVDVLIKEKGMEQISDPEKLNKIINDVLDNNSQSIEDYKNGKDRAIKAIMGQCMKQTRGKANPKVLNALVIEQLNKR